MKYIALKKRAGFTLIEVLVAAIILGVGMLGILSLQSTGLQYNQQAYFYSQATFLANDIADRMRSNRTEVASYITNFNVPYSGASAVPNCAAADCVPVEMAAWDVNDWKGAIERILPGGQGAVQPNGAAYDITVQFIDSRIDNDADATNNAVPHFVSVVVQI